MSQVAEPSGSLSLHQLDAMMSLQNREQRAQMMHLARAFSTLPAPISAEWIRQLFQLENKLHRIIQNDKKWFFNHHGDPDADMFARDMHILHGIAANSLASLIERHSEWSSVDSSDSLRQVIAFQMYHQGAAIKWSFFRREPISPTVWPQLHRLYEFAEQQQLHLQTATLFTDEAEHTCTVASLYIRALLLDLLNTGNLNMSQIEIADGWLAAWTSQYQLINPTDAVNGRLYVEFNSTKGLKRVINNTVPSPSRYLCLASLASQLDMVRDAMRLGLPYQGRGIANLFAMEEHVVLLKVIERLNASIENDEAISIERRRTVQHQQVKVVFGFHAVYEALSGVKVSPSNNDAFSGFTLSLEPILSNESGLSHEPTVDEAQTKDKPLEATNGWALTDKSATGMGFIVKSSLASRIETEHLLGIQLINDSTQSNLQLVTVARKIEARRDDANQTQTRLGTQIICTHPIAVTLTHHVTATTNTNTSTNITPANIATTGKSKIPALFLRGADTRGRDDTLLLALSDTNITNPASSFTLETTTTKFVLKLNRAQRKGGDWISFRFEVIA